MIGMLQYQHITTTTETLLAVRASLEKREAELKLTSMVNHVLTLAQNPSTVSALASAPGPENHFAQLLRNQSLAVKRALVTIADYRGRGIASTVSSPTETLQHGIAEPVARLEIIARMLLSRTDGDSINRDLAAAVLETSNVLQTLLAQTCPSPTSLPHGEQND